MAQNKQCSYSKMEEAGTRNSYTSKQNTTTLKHKWTTTTTTTTKTPQNLAGKAPNPPTPLLAPVAHSVIIWVPIGFGDPAPVALLPSVYNLVGHFPFHACNSPWNLSDGISRIDPGVSRMSWSLLSDLHAMPPEGLFTEILVLPHIAWPQMLSMAPLFFHASKTITHGWIRFSLLANFIQSRLTW